MSLINGVMHLVKVHNLQYASYAWRSRGSHVAMVVTTMH